MTTGLTTQTFKNLQLNAGCFVAMDVSTYETVEALKEALAGAMDDAKQWLGATRGGGTFQCVPTIRGVEVDGKRSEFVGSTVIDAWDVKLTTTLLETTPENFARALMCVDSSTTGQKTTLKVRSTIKDTDYIPHLAWVGDTAYGLTVIELDNALNLAGANFTFTDKGEGTLPVEFQAHQSNMLNQDFAPCRVHFLETA